MEEDFDTWIEDLKRNLLTDCDLDSIRAICNGNPFPSSMRAQTWKVCLGIDKNIKETSWDEIFDLSEQPLIRTDCVNLVGLLGNEDSDNVSVVSDVESVITKYSKESNCRYSGDCKWLDVLSPLIALNLPKKELFNYFHTIQKMYIPKNCSENSNPFHLLRLLLLYHEPEICSLLDTKKITPECYAKDWFSSLFSSACNLDVILALWDIHFQCADPFFVFFLALVLIVNCKDQLLGMKEESREAIIETIHSLPCNLEEEDVKDFCTLSMHYVSCTPHSFAKEYFSLIFDDDSTAYDSSSLSQALCLPVSVQDLVLGSDSKVDNNVKFFVVDCRPADQYNSGHLSTAFHLESSLMLQEPSAFSTAVEALLAAKDQSIAANFVAAGEQICFMGSGREEEDQYVHMVIASFLQKHQKYVSLTKGGYGALHSIVLHNLDDYLANHCPKTCLECKSEETFSNGVQEKDISIIDKLATAVKAKGGIVRERLLEYMINPQPTEERHVNCRDPIGKRYRGVQPVFSIDDDTDTLGHQQIESQENIYEEVKFQIWKKNKDVIGMFDCHEIKEDGSMYPSYLVVTNTHMYILRVNPQKKEHAFIVGQRPLANIVKITSKRRHPEIITFRHSLKERGRASIIDQLLIPKAGDATHLVKYHIPDVSQSLETR